uniref:Uncharacterized protein n=1 Tax=Arundo donax TaxID=35708 RepID=A0A0A9CQH9_ARUDO
MNESIEEIQGKGCKQPNTEQLP